MDRTSRETIDGITYICHGNHEKHEPCEWSPAPVEAPTNADGLRVMDKFRADKYCNGIMRAIGERDYNEAIRLNRAFRIELIAHFEHSAQLESPWIPASTPPTEYSSWTVQLKGGFITDDTFHVVDQSWRLHGNEVEAYQPLPAPFVDKEKPE